MSDKKITMNFGPSVHIASQTDVCVYKVSEFEGIYIQFRDSINNITVWTSPSIMDEIIRQYEAVKEGDE